MNSKNLFWAFLVLLLLPLTAHAAEKVSKETLTSQSKKRTYYLFVPDSVKESESIPLVVLLHGSNRNGLSLVDKWKELASREKFIIVGPDSSDSKGWRVPEDGPDFIRDLVESLMAKYKINSRRVYLFGHSAGAVFAMNLAMIESEYFAATAVHAGSWRDEDEFSVIALAKRKSPLAIIVGDRDAFFPLSSVTATEAALKGRGFPIEVSVMKGHDHWYYDLAPEINRNAWGFLKRHELKEEPRYAAFVAYDKAEDINSAVKEINALIIKGNNSLQLFYAKEKILSGLDHAKGREAVAAVAREQVGLLTESASAFREAALKAERLSGLKLGGQLPEFFSLTAQAERKKAEALDALRERAQLLLSDEQPDSITAKRNEAAARAERLFKEAGELEQAAERVRTGQR